MTAGSKHTQSPGARPVGRPKGVRKPESHLPKQLREALARKALETGSTIADQLVELAYSDDKRSRMPAIRAVYEILIPVEDAEMAPEEEEVVTPPSDEGLPARRPDPAKVVPIRAEENDDAG